VEPQDVDNIAAEQAKVVARELLESAQRGGTEADFRREAALILDRAGAAAGLTVLPRDEFTVACGRVDSLYNRLILEYKKPGLLTASNSNRANTAVIQQIKDYIRDVARRERREAHRLAGVATDGFYYIFVRQVGEGWSVDDPVGVNAVSTEVFLRLLFSLCTGAALVPENLVEHFGPRTLQAQRAVRALYQTLESSKDPLVGKLFEQWKLFYSEATDYANWAERIESKEEFRSFIRGVGIDAKKADPATVFYALHTYYALLIKLVAWLAAARFAGDEASPKTLKQLAAKSGDDLKQAFADLERGGIFREYGIRNFLEGDFFRWYLSAWNGDVEKALSQMAQRLGEYDPGTIELAPENARDLLKKLYHGLLPREIRHDLGEYYTPDWLAERLIIQTLGSADLGNAVKRVLDPACGSGTFLVILIKYIKERAAQQKRNPADTLDLILRNVVGIDLNPLAVIAARTNYLLALGDLVKARKGEIDIPVYQADSVLTPSRGTNLFEGDVYPLKTSAAVFRIPAVFAQRERIDALANTLDECVENKVSESNFLRHLKKVAHLDDQEAEAISEEIKGLYRQICGLHDDGMNGVWARIIKNNFAPLFLEPCHYIVGNPPWVNWNNLPDDYRRSTMPLWEHYGLFPKRESGMDTILGAASYDISMLMTYVSADKYLLTGGKLGFVLPQNLFKSAAAGQGFRRFSLPGNIPIGPLTVEDMVELNPFEGASNRTSVAIFSKNRAVSYPVTYQYWKKKNLGRGSGIGFDTPYEEVTSNKITFKDWKAEPVDSADRTSPWLTARPKSLRVLRRLAGASRYVGRIGIKCSMNGVFWLAVNGKRPSGLLMISNVTEGAKRSVPSVQAAIESELVYPLLRGMDVQTWSVKPDLSVLLTHEEGMRLKAIPVEEMQSRFPKAWGYLHRFEDDLRKSGIIKRYFKPDAPFYSIFNIGDYSFAPYKVVIREIAGGLTCAVAGEHEGKPIIPDHKLVMVGFKREVEAHYVCALLNSSPARLFVDSYVINTQFSPHLFEKLAIPDFDAQNKSHVRLSKLSKQAHETTNRHEETELKLIVEEIEQVAAETWELTGNELADVRSSLADK
jgi:SAM-dependent methyltransferase